MNNYRNNFILTDYTYNRKKLLKYTCICVCCGKLLCSLAVDAFAPIFFLTVDKCGYDIYIQMIISYLSIGLIGMWISRKKMNIEYNHINDDLNEIVLNSCKYPKRIIFWSFYFIFMGICYVPFLSVLRSFEKMGNTPIILEIINTCAQLSLITFIIFPIKKDHAIKLFLPFVFILYIVLFISLHITINGVRYIGIISDEEAFFCLSLCLIIILAQYFFVSLCILNCRKENLDGLQISTLFWMAPIYLLIYYLKKIKKIILISYHISNNLWKNLNSKK